ncbi:MarR family transcriptional regulator [Candidatus Woesearchaeota archaeon]|nr:MarR family transcriptional regulator [Candidatus Woesearchaeota archaeon]
MKNKIAGYIIIGIALLFGLMIWMFNNALSTIVSVACTHGPDCPMWRTINVQTSIGLAIMIFIILIGVYLIFFGFEEKIVTKTRTVHRQVNPNKPSKKNYEKIMNKLSVDQKKVLEKIISSQGSMFQSEIVSSTKLSKVKVTRILDRLEGLGLVDRKRRGMTNIVILK